jgi:hypothetical protein
VPQNEAALLAVRGGLTVVTGACFVKAVTKVNAARQLQNVAGLHSSITGQQFTM